MTTQADVIQLEDLRKDYGRIHALRGMSLSIHTGEIFGLLGPNGAGKSTLIKVLVGSSRPSGGTIRVMGRSPIKEAACVAEVLDLIGLRSRERDAVYRFSGGMKQRVSLACALVHKPSLLLLDEPTAGVDPRLRETFWHHFRELATQGTTVLLSTHQMDEAQRCDRLAILHEGKLLAMDSPSNLLHTGQAAIRIKRGSEVETLATSNYPEELPRILQQYRLDPAISRIEVEEETLEAVMLKLIHAREERDAGRS